MLRLMARALAAVHLGVDDEQALIKHDIARRNTGWLKPAVQFTRREQTEWRRRLARR